MTTAFCRLRPPFAGVTQFATNALAAEIIVDEEKARTISLEDNVTWLRAAGEQTRMRLLTLMDRVDLTVSDLVTILGQSQPRLSRHLKLLVEAGLTERFQEGAWAYFRNVDRGPARTFLDTVLGALDSEDDVLAVDLERLAAVRDRRARRAADYFAANAERWGRIRSMHVAEADVEETMLRLGLEASPRTLLDLGTGTGRILELFAPHVERGLGIDTSHDMLAVARAALADAELGHVQARFGDVYQLDVGKTYDLIVLHQVLHFLEDPALALKQAQQRLSRNGRLLIVDFAPHEFEFLREEHTHRRLGMSTKQIERWLSVARLSLLETDMMVPDGSADNALTVALWLAGRKTP